MNAAVARIMKELVSGYSTVMTCSYFLDEAAAHWGDDDGHYKDVAALRELVHTAPAMTGASRTWLDTDMMFERLDDPAQWPAMTALFRNLENYDIGVGSALDECEMSEDDFDDDMQARAAFAEFVSGDYNRDIDGLLAAAAVAAAM